jgi:hypothetical protein
MFVQYSFVEKHDYPNFKKESIRLGSVSIVIVGILAMAATTIAYVAF